MPKIVETYVNKLLLCEILGTSKDEPRPSSNEANDAFCLPLFCFNELRQSPLFVCCIITLITHAAYLELGVELYCKQAYQIKAIPSRDYTNKCNKSESLEAGGPLITVPHIHSKLGEMMVWVLGSVEKFEIRHPKL